MNKLMLFTALSGSFLSSGLSSGALAQTSYADVITVTAQRREQSPQDVGIALDAFSGEDLIAAGVSKVNGLENISPSLEIESQFGGGQPSFSIRGVGFRDYATNNSPTVGVYVDDIAYPIPAMTQGVIFDVDRVEVLRGPQGTLYGRNTTGGAIKIISAKPTDEFAAGLVVEGGRFGRVDAEGYVSGPLSDDVRVRVSAATAHGGAWQVNRETGEELGDAEQYALRTLVEADLSDTVTALFNIHGFIDQSDGLGLQLFNDSVLGPTAHASRRETSYGSSPEFMALTGIAVDQHPFRDNKGWGGGLTLTADLGDVDVIYIGAYEQLDRTEFNDWDAMAAGVSSVYFQSFAEVMSHELRFTGAAASDRLRWVGGLYYSDEYLDESYQSDFVDFFGPGYAVTTPYQQDARTLAAYLHGDFDLTDSVTIVAGVRYEDEKRELENLGTFATGIYTGINFANGLTDGTLENRELSSGNVSGKIGLDITPADNLLIYASYSRGVKSGGFTAYNTLNPNALTPFTPEKLNAYEIGFKSDFAEDTVRLNGAVFYYDYKDQQVQSAVFDPLVSAIIGRIVNAPKSEIYGGEIELVWTPSSWITIGQSFGYKDGEFKEFTDLDTAATGASSMEVLIDRAGQSLGLPNISYIGYADIETTLSNGYSVGFRFDYSYRDDLTPPLLGPVYTVDDYWLANAQLTFGPGDGRWELAFWGRNILNAEYDETRNFFAAPGGVADIAAPGMPATYGARISLRY